MDFLLLLLCFFFFNLQNRKIGGEYNPGRSHRPRSLNVVEIDDKKNWL